MVVSHWRHQLPGSHATTRHHRRRGSAPFDSPQQGVAFPPMTRLSRFPPYCRRITANKVAPLIPSQTRLIYGNFFTIKASRYEHTYFLSGYLHRLEFRIDLRGRRLILTGWLQSWDVTWDVTWRCHLATAWPYSGAAARKTAYLLFSLLWLRDPYC